MAEEDLYPFSVLENWGTDYDGETRAEVAFWVINPLFKTPFLRDVGSNLVETDNQPAQSMLLEIAKLDAANSIGNYFSIAAPERRAVTSSEMITTKWDDQEAGEATIEINYVRTFDAQTERITI